MVPLWGNLGEKRGRLILVTPKAAIISRRDQNAITIMSFVLRVHQQPLAQRAIPLFQRSILGVYSRSIKGLGFRVEGLGFRAI